MQSDVLWTGLEQFRHQGLAQPKRLALKAAFDTGPAILGLVQDDLAAGLHRVFGHRTLS